MLRQTIELFKKYGTKEIQGRGSFICYQAGGSGPAMLHYLKLADCLAVQVEDGARRMVQQQQRSTDGLLIPTWAKRDQVFIDMAFAVTPYLLYSGLALDRPDYVDLAVPRPWNSSEFSRTSRRGWCIRGDASRERT